MKDNDLDDYYLDLDINIINALISGEELSEQLTKKFQYIMDWNRQQFEQSHQKQPEQSHEKQSKRSDKVITKHDCCCCFDTYPQDQIAKCNNNHMICKGCINNGAKTAIDEMKLFKCPHEGNCDQFIDEFIIDKFVNDDNITKAYSKLSIHVNIGDIEGVYKCIYCDYAAIIEEEVPDIFFCRKCKKNYCLKCNEESHEGQKCKQKFHDKAEELTKKHTIYCCGRIIVRYGGCNHLTCNICGKSWCYYCKGSMSSSSNSNEKMCRGNCPSGDPPEPPVIKFDESVRK
jgi:hypothetical protein